MQFHHSGEAMTETKWTAEAAYYFYTMERERFAEMIPVEVQRAVVKKVASLQNRYPHLYCSVPEEKFGFRYNKENWVFQHCKVLAAELNKANMPVWIMGELSQPCPACTGIGNMIAPCAKCLGLGRIP